MSALKVVAGSMPAPNASEADKLRAEVARLRAQISDWRHEKRLCLACAGRMQRVADGQEPFMDLSFSARFAFSAQGGKPQGLTLQFLAQMPRHEAALLRVTVHDDRVDVVTVEPNATVASLSWADVLILGSDTPLRAEVLRDRIRAFIARTVEEETRRL